MADDERRGKAFGALRDQVGTSPAAILEAPVGILKEITRTGGSIAFEERAERLRIAARLVLEKFGGDLNRVLNLTVPKAKKALMEFPMIGEPGAEKILLFCGALDVLALESNGLRTLVRLGFGLELKSYPATYKSVREATLEQLPRASGLLAKAHSLLKQHGQQVCLRNSPRCGACPVSSACNAFRRGLV